MIPSFLKALIFAIPITEIQKGELLIRCPACGGNKHRVLKAHKVDERIERIRKCFECNNAWISAEAATTQIERK